MSAENKALVRRLIRDFWSKGKLEVADAIVATNYANHDPAGAMPDTGREGLKKHATMYRTAFPDLQFAIDDLTVEGNKVTVRWTARGTHQGELLGITPTGKKFSITGISFLRITNGKIAEQWVNWDTLGLLQQLGAVPQFGQPKGQAAR